MTINYDADWLLRVMDAMEDMVLVKGPKSRLLWANQAFLDCYGMTNEELANIIDGPQSDPDDTIQYVRDDHRVFTSGQPLDIPAEAVTNAAGDVSHFHTKKSPIFGADGQVEQIVAVARLIEDPERAARSAQERKDRKESLAELRAFVSNIPLAAAMLDMKGRVLSCSNAWLALFSVDDEIIGEFYDELFESRLPLSATIAEVSACGEEREIESRQMAGPSGQTMTVNVKISPWSMPTRGMTGSIVLIQDITDQIKDRESLEVVLARYEAAVNGANDGLWTWDVASGDVFFAERFKNLLGFSGDELPHAYDAWAERLHPDDRDQTLARLQDHLDNKSPYDVDYRLRMKNNEYRWFRAKGQAVWDDQGRPLRMAGVISDIQEKKQTEEELRRSNYELEQFAYVASHDLQAPLRHVTSFSQILADECGDNASEEVHDCVRRIHAATERMQRLISDLLAFSRVGRKGLTLTSADMGALAAEAMETLDAEIDAAGARVEAGPLPTQRVDATQIAQLFQNLLQNAVKFRAKGREPEITVQAEETARAWRYCVADNGIGVAPEYREKIFHVFQRLHRAEQVEGTGVGLSICRKIATAHGGDIWVESEPGEGSRFYFEIAKDL